VADTVEGLEREAALKMVTPDLGGEVAVMVVVSKVVVTTAA